MRRKTGYISAYSLKMFYGAFRANLYYRSVADPVTQIFGKWYSIPHWAMPVFAPFNQYTHSMRGISHMRGHYDD